MTTYTRNDFVKFRFRGNQVGVGKIQQYRPGEDAWRMWVQTPGGSHLMDIPATDVLERWQFPWEDRRCPAVHNDGDRCEWPQDHDGKHWAWNVDGYEQDWG